ncbi:MAG: hypothetical protein QM610_15965 [Chitinophagaceae bacterium]
MKVVLFILIGVFCICGYGIFVSSRRLRFKYWGVNLVGLCYLLSAFIAYRTMSFYPLIIGFALTFLIGKLFGEPDLVNGSVMDSDFDLFVKTASMDVLNDINKSVDDFMGNLNTKNPFRSVGKSRERISIIYNSLNKDRVFNEFFQTKGITENRFVGLFNKLERVGCSGVRKGYYVSAAAICYPMTLSFVLKCLNDKDEFSVDGYDEEESNDYVCLCLKDFFENNRKSERIEAVINKSIMDKFRV